jgi:predicted cupin superfamily sugar epimerase
MPQALAPGSRWMGARVTAVPDAAPGGAGPPAAPAGTPNWALVGCVVSPGFEYEDFEPGNGDTLLQAHPEAADYILALSGG